MNVLFEDADEEFGPELDELFVVDVGDVPFVWGNCKDVPLDDEDDVDTLVDVWFCTRAGDDALFDLFDSIRLVDDDDDEEEVVVFEEVLFGVGVETASSLIWTCSTMGTDCCCCCCCSIFGDNCPDGGLFVCGMNCEPNGRPVKVRPVKSKPGEMTLW